MFDPAGYLANLGSDLTMAVLKALRRRAEEFALGTPKYQALKRCYAAAEAALLPPDDPLFPVYQPVLQEFLADPAVAQELAKLVKGNRPDLEELIDVLADLTYQRDLPDFDLRTRLAAAIEAFLQMAETETALQADIQTAQLRAQTELLETLPDRLARSIQRLVQGIRTGNLTFSGDAAIEGDVNTGVIIKINSPPPPPPDPCAGLGRRYLAALQAEVNRLPLAELEDEGARQRSAPLTLNRVYIELNTTTRVPLDETEKEKAEFRWEKERPLTALEAAQQQPRLALTGDPGGGKSAFANYLAYRLAAAHLSPGQSDLAWPAPLPWPIRLILRDLAADLATEFNLEQVSAWPAGRQRAELRRACLDHRQKEFQRAYGLTPAEAEQWSSCLAGRLTLTIFDGLDEVSLEHLPLIRTLIEAVADHHPGPILVTCRIRSYQSMPPLAGFSQATLESLNRAQIDAFIEHWYAAQAHIPPAQRPERIADLRQAVRAEALAELVGNPLLLTTMALVHTANVRLPDRRVELYQRSVDVLLRRWQTHKFGQQALLHQLGVDSQLLLRGLWRLAYEAHQSGRSGQLADVDEDTAAGILARACFGGDKNKADRFLSYVDRQAGLLVGRGGSEREPRQYTFAHRTFQEFLAGCHLALGGPEGLAASLAGKLAEGERWYLAGQLAAHHLLYNVGLDRDVYELLRWLCPARPPQTEAEWRGAAWAGALVAEIEPARLAGDDHPDGGPELLARLIPRLQTLVAQGMLTVAERAEAGDALAALNGDDRPGVNLISPQGERPGATALPQPQFCLVPPGPFWLGSRKGEDDQAISDEYGHSEPVDLAYPYWISRYPVTQMQYWAFTQATGHPLNMIDEDWARPYLWREGEPPAQRRNHPVVLVSWRDAMAYCAWLNEVLAVSGQPSAVSGLAGEQQAVWAQIHASLGTHHFEVRLPTEAEWEKAARGGLEIPAEPVIVTVGAEGEAGPGRPAMIPNPAPRRRWPWGEWDEASPQRRANTVETNRRGTMAVGSFPAGASPYGCLDMAGNVWEWTLSKFREYPYRDDGRNDPGGNESRAIRGGSWYDDQRDARVSSRFHDHPDLFLSINGFRLVLAPVF